MLPATTTIRVNIFRSRKKLSNGVARNADRIICHLRWGHRILIATTASNVFSLQIPERYYCFCKKEINPPNLIWHVPHSCGNMCRKDLQCGHQCVLLCHPGPCPPCAQMVSISCECGQSPPRTVRCIQKLWKCANKVGTSCYEVYHPEDDRMWFLNNSNDYDFSARKCCRAEFMCVASHATSLPNARRAQRKVCRAAFAAIVNRNGIVTVWFGPATNCATKRSIAAATNARRNAMLSVAHVRLVCLDRARAAKRSRKHRAQKILARAEILAKKHSNVAITFVRNAAIEATVGRVLKLSRRNAAAASTLKSCRASNSICAKRNANKLVIVTSMRAIER